MRARERHLVALPEPVLYEKLQLTMSDSNGNAYGAYRCPVALAQFEACACHIVRQGTLTKHGVIGPGFPCRAERSCPAEVSDTYANIQHAASPGA